jgi:protein-S-isoprenylcysteine O-methyltransferase Ste14
MKMLKLLTGSGDKFGPFVLPFIILGFILYFIFPSLFSIPQSNLLKIFGLLLLISGLIVCIWSQILILIKVPKKQLITKGPYALVKHPLYTGVSLLVLPGLGFLLGNLLGILFGLILYIATRIYRPEEEKRMKKEFGEKYEKYSKSVLFPRL